MELESRVSLFFSAKQLKLFFAPLDIWPVKFDMLTETLANLRRKG
jgi:hypothetical protein